MKNLSSEEKVFNENGKVSFFVSNKESVLIKKNIKSLVSVESLARKNGLKYFLLKKIHMIKGIISTLKMSFSSDEASDVFDFFVMNKSKIGEVEAKDISDNKVSFTFYKK